VLICPWHGFEYDLVNGEELYRERPTHLRMYATSIENGDVMIEIPMRVVRGIASPVLALWLCGRACPPRVGSLTSVLVCTSRNTIPCRTRIVDDSE
jgi:hypothetical protein